MKPGTNDSMFEGILKNRVRIICLVVCIVGVTFFPPAFRVSTNAVSELDQLIARIEARYGNMRGLAADFEQTYSGPGMGNKRERGRVFLQRPKLMRWEYEPKPGKLFIVNDREVWLYSPADREATRADAGKISDVRFPFLFLLGQKNLRRQFRQISYAPEDRGPSHDIRTLRLVPRRTDTGITEIIVDVSTDGRISRVKHTDAARSVSEFLLMNVRENYVAPAGSFEFSPPPGVNVRHQK